MDHAHVTETAPAAMASASESWQGAQSTSDHQEWWHGPSAPTALPCVSDTAWHWQVF